MKPCVLVCVLFCSSWSFNTAIAQGQGNGIVFNADTTSVEVILRKRGSTSELTKQLAPGETIRLRKHAAYELFLPSESSVYDLDARITGVSRNPWNQQIYSLFRNAQGQWKLGNGWVSDANDSARRMVGRVEKELARKWERSLGNAKSLRVDPAQLRFCQAFMLEAFLRDTFELRMRIHPDPWWTGENAEHPAELTIEALTCKNVPIGFKRGITKLVKTALRSPNANVRFMVSCEDVDESVWNGFADLCDASPGVIQDPTRQVNFFNEMQERFAWLGTGTYQGLDGSGSDLDIAAQEYRKMKRVQSLPGFSILAGAESAVRDDIRVLLQLATTPDPQAAVKQRLMRARIDAHYGCSFLYVADPRKEPHPVSIDSRPVVDVFRPGSNGIQERSRYMNTYTVQKRITLLNVGIKLNAWQTAKYRPRGYCQLINRTANPTVRNRLEQKFKHLWMDLPIGDDVGHRFEASDKYCIRVSRPNSFKIFDFVPTSHRDYSIGPTGIVEQTR
ncbi:MAG: hypothetical protein AAF989_00595 [Planctomycetota bacterium]